METGERKVEKEEGRTFFLEDGKISDLKKHFEALF